MVLVKDMRQALQDFGGKVEFFFHLLCLSKKDREKVFADVLDRRSVAPL